MARPLTLRIIDIDRNISIKSFIIFGDECLPILRRKRGKPSSFKTRLGESTYIEKILYYNIENRYEGMWDPIEYE